VTHPGPTPGPLPKPLRALGRGDRIIRFIKTFNGQNVRAHGRAPAIDNLADFVLFFMMFRTGQPCAAGWPHGAAPTVLSLFMLFRAGDHAGLPLRFRIFFMLFRGGRMPSAPTDSRGRPRGVVHTSSYCVYDVSDPINSALSNFVYG